MPRRFSANWIGSLLAAAFVALILPSCTFSPNSWIASGTMKDDDIAEPLPASAKHFENALQVSNAIVKLVQNRNFEKIYDNYFSEKLRGTISKKEFLDKTSAIHAKAGDVESWKEMQWGFGTETVQGVKVVSSKKIVHHQKAVLDYTFQFTDENAKRIDGFFFKDRALRKPTGGAGK